MHEPPLGLGVVREPGRRGEDLLEDAQPDGRLVVRGRHEDALRRIDPEPEDGRGVEVREEHEDVELVMLPLQIVDERRTPGSLLPNPLHLVVARVRVAVNPVGVFVEGREIAGPRVREAADRHTPDPIVPLGILVLPGDVVAGAGREHFDLVPRGKALGDHPAQILGSPRTSAP